MDDVLWTAFYTSSYGSPTAATGTRRKERGTLERFSKTLINICYSFVNKESCCFSEIEYEVLAMLGRSTQTLALLSDVLYMVGLFVFVNNHITLIPSHSLSLYTHTLFTLPVPTSLKKSACRPKSPTVFLRARAFPSFGNLEIFS